MPKYWIGVASREHVMCGVSGGFCQVCHGKPGPLRQMAAGDGIIYYSPTERFGEAQACRKFTAIGQVLKKDPYLFRMSADFAAWRRDVTFYAAKEISIESLIDKLSFIQDKKRWGFPFRRGCFAISFEDFSFIAFRMGIEIHGRF